LIAGCRIHVTFDEILNPASAFSCCTQVFPTRLGKTLDKAKPFLRFERKSFQHYFYINAFFL